MKFQDKLYELRRQRGLSQEQLADLCKVSRQAVSKWENGTANPDLNNIKALAYNLQVSSDELLGNQAIEAKPYRRDRFHKEYVSGIKILGIPLLHVCIGRGRTDSGGWHIAKGIIAIGNVSIGVISIGLMSLGCLSVGVLSLGLLFALGALSLGYLALGALAIGYLAVGAIAIGVYSIGAISIGFGMSIGAVSYGTTAIGPQGSTYGDTVIYLGRSMTDATRTCYLPSVGYDQLQSLLKTHELPFLIEGILKNIPLCR